MAELNENQLDNEKAEKPAPKSRGGFWFVIIMLLIILALAGVGYLLFDQLREKQQGLNNEIEKEDSQLAELTKQISGYQAQLVAIQTHLTNLDTEIAGKETHIDNKLHEFVKLQDTKLEQVKDHLGDAIERIQRQLGKTRGDWLIADAEYLMSVANRRLHLTYDVNTSLEALKAADHRLRESGDAAAFKVREQLTREIAALKKIKLPDIVGMYSKIQMLEENVEQLALFLPYAGKGLLKDKAKSRQDGEQTPDMLDSALENLGGLVTIRHTDRPVEAVLSKEEAIFLKEQLKVKLEMVKIALVQRNDALYKKTLTEAQHWVQEHFRDNSKRRDFLNELNQMLAIELRRQLPDISKSLKMLRDIAKLRIETDKALQKPTPPTK